MGDEMGPRVLVTQFIKNADFSSAEEYGEVIFMTNVEHRPEPTDYDHNNHMGFDILDHMQDYEQGLDFILITPSQLPNLFTGNLLGGGAHKILKWDNRQQRYRLHILNIGNDNDRSKLPEEVRQEQDTQPWRGTG